MCLSPISLQTDKGRISVPCSRCIECLQSRRSEWTFRLLEELKVSKAAHFITLTYESKNLPLLNIDTGELLNGESDISELKGSVSPFELDVIQKFLKRLRKENAKHWSINEAKIRYFLVGEKGEKFARPHYHAIIFNIHPKTLMKLESIWGLGFVKIGNVEQASIHYCTKYILNFEHERFCLMSKKPILGHSYITKESKRYHKNNRDPAVRFESNHKTKMPRAIRKRIFSKVESQSIGVESSKEMVKKDQKDIKKLRSIDYGKFLSRNAKLNTQKAKKQSRSKDL